ncbi:MAG: hypothetical protein AB1650_02090 [Candidatus Omnitrophota bacterium]
MKPHRILLLYKISAYQHYRNVSCETRPDSIEVNRFKQTHEEHYKTINYVENVLRELGLMYEKFEREQIRDYQRFDMVIAVGGDGTLLEGAYYVRNQLMLGVNSDPSWSVGRLCSAEQGNFKILMEDLLADRARIAPLNRLKVIAEDQRQEVVFLNDILICHARPASQSRYVLSIDGHCEEHRGSGLWISTAAGSSGAIHSAGGQILGLESREIQYRPRELYLGWKNADYKLRGGVLAPETKIRVGSLMAEGVIFIDGSHRFIQFPVSEQVLIEASEFPLNIIQTRS